MAQPDLDFFTSRAVAIKAQPLPGTDPVPTSAVNSFQLLDGKSTTAFDKQQRNLDRPYLGNQRYGVTNKRATVEGTIEIIPPVNPGDVTDGKTTTGLVLAAAGMVETYDPVTFKTFLKPISRAIPAVAARWYHAGTRLNVQNARANMTGFGIPMDDRFKAAMVLQGAYTQMEEVAMPTDWDYTEFLDPTFVTPENSLFEFGLVDGSITALANWGKSLTVDFGNTLTQKRYTTLRRTDVAGRAGTFNCLVARPAKADFDLWALRDAGTLITMTYKLIEADGRYSQMYAQGQLDQITDTNVDGDRAVQLTGVCIPVTGNDEFNAEFGGGHA